MGGDGLSLSDQKKVLEGNRLVATICSYIKSCIKYNVPVVVENPVSSRLWIYPPLARLLVSATSDVSFDHCQFGCGFRKPTRLVAWNVDISVLQRKCQGKAICSRTGRPHDILSGVSNGQFRTASGSAYPKLFAKQVAGLLHDLALT